MLRPLRLATFLAATSLLAACGSDPSAPPGGTATAAPAGPLSDFLDADAPADSTAFWEESDRKVQELTAECMQQQGFEYTPVVQSRTSPDPNAEANKLWGTRKYAEKYGFGIHLTPMGVLEPLEEFVDPNQEYVEAMSPAEQQAYWTALHGSGWAAPVPDPVVGSTPDPPSTTGETTSSQVMSGEQSVPIAPDGPSTAPSVGMAEMGCNGRSAAEVYGDREALYDDPEVAAMWDEFKRASDEIGSEPDVVAATEAWSSCLADRGFPGHDDPEGVDDELYDRWSQMYGMTMTEVDDSVGLAVEPSTGPAVPGTDEIEAFKHDEIVLAIADFECRGDLEELRRTKQFAMEEGFVAEHLEVLTRIREAQGGISGGGG